MKKGGLAQGLLAGTSALGFMALNLLSVAQAQTNNTQTGNAQANATAKPATEDMETVIVVGSRQAQQSAIDRKKRANTAVDSIIADDVGSFPDRNLNEALSRIAGVAIARNDMGEGEGISLRGNGPDLTRVEMDGMSVNGGGADLAINGVDAGGRGADLRELPADLIKSVDVVKGQTADMTEGGLGGSVLIKTRSGLDFKKPYFSMRVAGDRNSLSQKWSPDINLVASRKFFDGRLGVIANLSTARRLNDSHQVTQSGTSNRRGYIRLLDLDNSPEKTYSLNPDVITGMYINRYDPNRGLIDVAAPIQSYALTSGSGTFNTNSAMDIVNKAAAAKTKADCDAAFPLYTQAQLNTIVAGTNNVNRANVQDQRIKERVSCLYQWNDYLPNTIQDRFKSSYEDRLAWDVRFDYRVNDHLTVYAKYQVANRKSDEQTRSRSRGQINISRETTNGTRSLVNNTAIPWGSIDYITPIATSNTPYLWNGSQTTWSQIRDSTAGSAAGTWTGCASTCNNAFPVYGIASNVVNTPGSVTVDANHHATQFQLSNISQSYDNIANDQIWENTYILAGGNYKNGPLSVDFQASHSDAYYQRTDARFRRSAPIPGLVTARVNEIGVWVIDLPAGFDPDAIENSYPLQAATATNMPRYTQNIAVTYDPRLTESAEDAAKIDATYRLNMPFFKTFKAGASVRKVTTDSWRSGGFTPKAGVTVPGSSLRGNIRACENTATTAAANACVYGYVPGTSNWLAGLETVSQQQLFDIYRNSVQQNDKAFMPGIEGFDGQTLWDTIDVRKAMSLMAGTVNFNLDCMKQCKGSDGQMYAMPFNETVETVTAAYYMASFEQPLPFGTTIEGNFGVRMVRSDVSGQGNVTLNSTVKNANWDAVTNFNSVTTTAITKPVILDKTYTDWLPSYNLALWLIDDKLVMRYHWSKTISRPAPGRLWPAGSCTYDERIGDLYDDDSVNEDEAGDMTCSTFGNPELKPYTATKNNTSIEWYPNKDTSLSLAYYRQKAKIGAPMTVRVTGVPVFEGSDEVDPVTGEPLSQYTFAYNTYVNGPGFVYSGWELSAKTAFSWAPWRFRYTGMDFNVSTNDSKGNAVLRDPITGENLGAAGRSDYFANLALWYDDGRTNARLSYQARDAVLSCITACGNDDEWWYGVPNGNPESGNYINLPYNPGEPIYTRAYGYLDAKVTHKLAPNIEIYWEGRNLLKEPTVTDGTRGFSEGEYPMNYYYAGRRFTFGMTYKLQ